MDKYRTLVQSALEARKNAYVPYSKFAVGAALLGKDGTIYKGCNIENAAYGPTNCAERTALFAAVAQGIRGFTALAVVGAAEGAEPIDICPPCGVCRQVLREFCSLDMPVLLGRGDGTYETLTLEQLLPYSFGPNNLGMG